MIRAILLGMSVLAASGMASCKHTEGVGQMEILVNGEAILKEEFERRILLEALRQIESEARMELVRREDGYRR